ncbi:MAG: CaiB/BaiF CoA transferase family protein, partial [Desulfotomaculales bacterium]
DLDGARVIRIEDPVRGDPNRYVGENRLGDERMRTYFLPINAGKRAVTLNLAHPRGQAILKELLSRLPVDVFCTNQLPKNYAKLGIGYEELRAVKPDLIWVGVTGFGPSSNEAAYDPVLQARSGLMDLNGEADGPPLVTGVPFIDMGASEHAYGLIMKALYKRAVTGEGSRLNLSMFQSALSWLTVPISLAVTFGKHLRRRGNTHEFFAPVSVYETSDGYVYLAVGNDRQWRSLVSLPPFTHLNEPVYATNVGRIADVTNLNAAINDITRTFTTNEIVELLKNAQVPVSEVRSIAKVVEDPLVKEAFLYADDQRTGFRLTLAPPPYHTSYLETSGGKLSFPPRFGEHNEEIYGSVLGLGAKELSELRQEQVI